MESDNSQSLEDVSSDDNPVPMTTLYSTSTAWTQATVWVESGKVQLPEYTIYSHLQPIEMASYPDPIMSATGTNLQHLLAQEHATASMSSMSDVGDLTATTTSSDSTITDASGNTMVIDVSVVPVTYTTEYLTTTLITIYPTDSLLLEPNVKVRPPTSTVSASIASTEITSFAQTLSETSSFKINTVNTVVPISVENPTSSVELDLLGRDKPPRGMTSSISKSDLLHADSHIETPPTYASQNAVTILVYILGAIVTISLIIHMFLMFRDRRDSTDLSYTSKPPRPGLRKRLSLSISMTTGRRPSIASTNSTEAIHVSGNAVSIGKAGGKQIGNKETEVRRTPSTPLLEV